MWLYVHCKQGRYVNLTALFLGMIRPPEWLTSTKGTEIDNCPSSVSGRRNERKLLDNVTVVIGFDMEVQPLVTHNAA